MNTFNVKAPIYWSGIAGALLLSGCSSTTDHFARAEAALSCSKAIDYYGTALLSARLKNPPNLKDAARAIEGIQTRVPSCEENPESNLRVLGYTFSGLSYTNQIEKAPALLQLYVDYALAHPDARLEFMTEITLAVEEKMPLARDLAQLTIERGIWGNEYMEGVRQIFSTYPLLQKMYPALEALLPKIKIATDHASQAIQSNNYQCDFDNCGRVSPSSAYDYAQERRLRGQYRRAYAQSLEQQGLGQSARVRIAYALANQDEADAVAHERQQAAYAQQTTSSGTSSQSRSNGVNAVLMALGTIGAAADPKNAAAWGALAGAADTRPSINYNAANVQPLPISGDNKKVVPGVNHCVKLTPSPHGAKSLIFRNSCSFPVEVAYCYQSTQGASQNTIRLWGLRVCGNGTMGVQIDAMKHVSAVYPGNGSAVTFVACRFNHGASGSVMSEPIWKGASLSVACYEPEKAAPESSRTRGVR